MARIEMHHTIRVDAPVEAAYSTFVLPDGHLEIFDLDEIRGRGEGRLQVGDSYQTVNRFMGQEIITTWNVVAADPPNSIRFETESNAADGVVTWTFEAVDGGTLVTLDSDGEPKGFLATVASRLLQGQADKLMSENLRRFKAAVEAQAQPT